MAKTKNKGYTYEEVVKNILNKSFKPIYCFMGEESYFIDKLTDLLIDTALTEEEKAFNLIMLQGAETNIEQIVNGFRSFPMGGERNVIVVKEAQRLSKIEQLFGYIEATTQGTNIVVLCYKNGSLDRRKKGISILEKIGVVFESNKLYERQLPGFITQYAKGQKVTIEPTAVEYIVMYIGMDLYRIVGEMDKLFLLLKDEKTITLSLVKQSVGDSRDYNNFEFVNAIAKKDVARSFHIFHYFEQNPKDNPVQVVFALLFKHFSAVLMAHYSPDKSSMGIAKFLEMNEWKVKNDIFPSLQQYSGMKAFQIIAEIRTADARSKGIENAKTQPYEILKELLFFILH